MYKRTLSREQAIASGQYIGEFVMRPKQIAYQMSFIFRKPLEAFVIHFYGVPDKRLRKMFGYKDTVSTDEIETEVRKQAGEGYDKAVDKSLVKIITEKEN